MKNFRIVALFISLMMMVFLVPDVSAAPPLSLHIVVEETIAGGSETFIASGTAVDGLVCETGTVVEVGTVTSNDPGGPFQMLWVTKRFDCGDGTFDMDLVVKLDKNTGQTTAQWKIVGGTFAYQNLKGSGKLVGTPSTPGEIVDVYDGKVH